jgi:hypothetical protein
LRRPRRIAVTPARSSDAGVHCQALPDGATVETGDSDYEPHALVNCGEAMDDDAVSAPNPVIVVAVLSPGTTSTGAKLADHFRVPSIAHYLIVHPTRRTVIHHRWVGDGIETRIIVNGPITMDPPGIVITAEEIYGTEQVIGFKQWRRPKGCRLDIGCPRGADALAPGGITTPQLDPLRPVLTS